MLSDLPHDKLVYLASPYSHPDPAGKPRPGGASVDILAACAKILRRKHGARGIDQKQFNGLIARVADMESYWLSLPSEHNWRVKEIKP